VRRFRTSACRRSAPLAFFQEGEPNWEWSAREPRCGEGKRMAKRHISKQQAPDGETAQEADARKRWVNNLFGYWHVCAARVCKRNRGCAGDPHACFERWWWMTPEAPKVQFRAYIKASCAGLSPQDALREADAEVERAAEHIARVDAETARAWEATQRAPTPLPPRALASGGEGSGVGRANAAVGPRVRAL